MAIKVRPSAFLFERRTLNAECQRGGSSLHIDI